MEEFLAQWALFKQKLDEEEEGEEEIREAFRLYDQDGDGYITRDEMLAALTQMGFVRWKLILVSTMRRITFFVMFKELRGGGVQVHGGDGPRQGREECLHVMNAQYSYRLASSGRESELRRVRAAVAGQLTAVSTL